MTNPNYPESVVSALKAQNVWTYAQAVDFAKEHGLKVRSVTAKIGSLGLQYIPKPKQTKAGAPVVAKATVVSGIESAMGVEASTFSGLEKATKQALFAVFSAARAMRTETETEAETSENDS